MMMPENPEDLWMSEEQRERIGRRMRDIAAERAARMKIADNELGQIEECTEQILASAGAIAKINRDDPDEVHSILGRAMGALEVVTLWLMREEDDAKHPELEAQRAVAQHADRQAEIERQREIERQAGGS